MKLSTETKSKSEGSEKPIKDNPAAPSNSKPEPKSVTAVIRRTSKVFSASDNVENIKKQVVKVTEPESENYIVTPLEVLELNQENVLLLWKKFAEQLPEGKRGAKALFSIFFPELLMHERKISVTVQAEAQFEKLNEVSISLEKFIKTHTGVTLEVKILVDKTHSATNAIYYTDEDMLKRLIEINPLIKVLQKKFGLEPDSN